LFELRCGVDDGRLAEPQPHRLERGPPDLARPRLTLVDQERTETGEHQPRGVLGARPIGAVGADDLAQLGENKACDRDILTALQRAFELAHQQRLGSRRKLPQVVAQPVNR
jgi:hypothetical protein